MKKLSVALTVLMVSTAALTACSGSQDTLAGDNRETQPQWGLTFYEEGTETEAETETESETEEETTASVTELDNGVKLLALRDIQLQSVSPVNVRSGPGTDFDKLGGLTAEETVTMTGICDNAWVRISFDGKTGYVSMKFLTSLDDNVSLDTLLEQVKSLEAGENRQERSGSEENSGEESSTEKQIQNETGESNAEKTVSPEESGKETVGNENSAEGDLAWATIDVNVRKGPKSTYDSIGQLKQGEGVKVLDSSDAWWWKVEFNGQEAYISVQYLTTEKPEE